jgi:hypothetical protein
MHADKTRQDKASAGLSVLSYLRASAFIGG